MLFFAPFVLYREVLISTSRRDARLTWMLYREVLISTSRRDARLTWMLYREVRMSRATGCRERPSLRQIIILNQNFLASALEIPRPQPHSKDQPAAPT